MVAAASASPVARREGGLMAAGSEEESTGSAIAMKCLHPHRLDYRRISDSLLHKKREISLSIAVKRTSFTPKYVYRFLDMLCATLYNADHLPQ
jgi:hypothetical protein